MSSFRAALLLAGACVVAFPAIAQDWKGMGRMEGRVLDSSGQPIEGATVKLELPSRGGGTTLKTDKKGRWAILGVAAGSWNVDIEKEGYFTKKVSIPLASESARMAPLEVRLEKAAPKGPPPELVAALKAGDEAYSAGRWAEARAEYEKVLASRPELTTIHLQIARCYSQEQNYVKELEHLQKVLDADPGNMEVRAVMAQEAIKGGLTDRAQELLKGLDAATIKEPAIFFNIAVLFLNQQRPEEAIEYFSKSIAVDPTYADGYYQRGLAYLGQQKVAECKADLTKFVELAPSDPKAETAKSALEQLK